jgi:hypothetical protein
MSESFEQWLVREIPPGTVISNPLWWAPKIRQALQSGEPVAWMSPNKQSLEFSRPDTVYGSHTIPLYASPQPVVDVNQQLVEALKACEECLMFIHGGEPLRTDLPLKLAKEALLSASKGGEL